MKNKLAQTISMVVFLFASLNIYAQTNTFPSNGKVGIGTTVPNASSLLEVKSTTKGVLIPRMTQTQRNAIASPATGLLIYQTDNTPGFYYYSGSAWTAVTPKAKGWSLTGNSGTDSSKNFIGTTDAHLLIFKVNNQKSGRIDYSATANTSFGYHTLNSNNTGNSNAAFGYNALSANTTGSENTAYGYAVLYHNTTGNFNTAQGYDALYYNTKGISNTANGYSALYSNTTGNNNTAVGLNALASNTTGHSNVAIGILSLGINTTRSNLVAIGDSALFNNGFGATNADDASYNTAVGSKTLYLNTIGYANSAFGYESLLSNTTGDYNTANGGYALYSNTTGIYNNADGYAALYSNTTGSNNTATGLDALYFNTTGNSNTAAGFEALADNTTGYSNIAIGDNALLNNTTASNLVAVGDSALYNNGIGASNFFDGIRNTALGGTALYSNTIGKYNNANGYAALYYNTTGADNTATGYGALYTNTTGNDNTGVGAGADVGYGTLSNVTAIGYVAAGLADNQVRIGNYNVTSIGGYTNWTNISDGRVKKNIKENIPGLAFINKLKPITYNLDLDAADKIIQRPVIRDKEGKTLQPSQFETDSRKAKEQIVYTGFVAQDVEKAAKSLNYNFSGVDPAKNSKDLYGLRYAEFVVPLVKAVQELSKMNDSKDSIINVQQNEINGLETRLSKIEALMHIQSTSLSSASLQQNIPNPFNHTTTISYSLSQTFSSAKIIVTDKSGKILKELNLSSKGKGSINIDASTLASGAYQYSLYVNGKLIDTKQMVLTK